MKTSHKSRKRWNKCLYKIIAEQNELFFHIYLFLFGFVFCFTSSNFYFVEKVGVQSGTPAPAREVPGPFHFLVEICGNDHRDQNQSTVFPANIKQKSMHFGVFKAFAILSPSKQSASSIIKNHQKSPKITKQRSMIINALCSFKVFAMMCFGMKATLGTFGENMPKPFEDILRALLCQFLS